MELKFNKQKEKENENTKELSKQNREHKKRK